MMIPVGHETSAPVAFGGQDGEERQVIQADSHRVIVTTVYTCYNCHRGAYVCAAHPNRFVVSQLMACGTT
ncbi:unnamed protein product [Schistocephalus solidus]|uniref:Transposase n=1 Tax=Schistocephalus solidus TaxID=70667 RepID=A0A183T5H5_SCHSO|nr:unnamed protein product [Schistocephalus solidus]